MRIALISDMHGNYVALDAALADLEQFPADGLVCLGDAIQGGPQPADTPKAVAALMKVLDEPPPPDTEAQRRAVYETERKFVTSFEYADLPGYAVVKVSPEQVTATMYSGVSREIWRTVNLTGLIS